MPDKQKLDYTVINEDELRSQRGSNNLTNRIRTVELQPIKWSLHLTPAQLAYEPPNDDIDIPDDLFSYTPPKHYTRKSKQVKKRG